MVRQQAVNLSGKTNCGFESPPISQWTESQNSVQKDLASARQYAVLAERQRRRSAKSNTSVRFRYTAPCQ